MCDHSVCIRLLYIACLHIAFCFSDPAFCLERDLFCCIQNVPGNYDKVCTPAPTIWALRDRLSVAL